MVRVISISILFFFNTAVAQKQYNVMDWKTDVTLNTYLVQLMHKQYDQRRIEFQNSLSSPKALAEYQKNIQKKFLRLLGPLPERDSLNATVTGTIQKDGYRIEKIVYESFANHHVTANLYIPSGKKKFPAALFFCGHEDAGKATESYQRTAILFVKNGFVVFVIDPISQAERYQIVDENGKPLTRGGTTEHTLLNAGCNLFGNSVATYELWDNVRALDYLVTRSEVDTSKIGCLGNSGGAMQTIYFAGYEPRVKIFAPCSYLENREHVLETTGPADGCAQIPGEGAEHLELDDYLISAAPKPLLILAGRYDFINFNGTLTAYEELKKVYTVFNQESKLKLFAYDDGHGISQPKREVAVQWFRKWFYDDDSEIKESTAEILTDKELFATATGNINTAYPEEISILKRNLQLFGSLDEKASMEKLEKIQSRSGNITYSAVEYESKGFVQNKGLNFEKLIIRKDGSPPLPVLVLRPKGEIKKIVMWLNEDGKGKMADSISLLNGYLDEGAFILLADSRGTGETTDKADLNDPKYYNSEYRNAMLALHVNFSLPAQRVFDVFTMISYVKYQKQLSELPIEFYASGINSIPAMLATFYNRGISSLHLYKGIDSFKDILEHPSEKNGYSYIINGILEDYDIKTLRQQLGKLLK